MYYLIKNLRGLIFSGLFMGGFLVSYAQNRLPEISNVLSTVDKIRKQVTISYKLSDADHSSANVMFSVSADGGKNYKVVNTGLSGDVGKKIMNGKRKFKWDYSKDDLLPGTLRFRITADDEYRINISDLLNQVNKDDFRKSLEDIARVRDAESEEGKKNLQYLKNKLQQTWTQENFKVERQAFTFGHFTGENIIARKTGSQNSDSAYVLLASFDGAENSPGANNNASGLAGVLAISKIISKYNFKNTIILLSTDYTGEEFIGSSQFVFKGGLRRYERVQAAIDLDRIGTFSNQAATHPVRESMLSLFSDNYKQIQADSSRANFLRVVSNTRSLPLAEMFVKTAKNYMPGLKMYVEEYPGYGEFVRGNTDYIQFSDHVAFWYRKYSAIWVTDAREGGRRDATVDDKVDKIDFDFATKVVKVSLATFVQLAGIEHTSIYEGSF